MQELRYRRLVRISGFYDFLATAAFATPWTFQLLYRLLNQISPMPAFDPTHVLFVNLMGSVILVWSALRIWRPEPILGLFDAFARGLFFCWQVYYLVLFGITPVTWAFAAVELLFGVTQAWGYWRLVKARPDPSRDGLGSPLARTA